MKTKRLHRYAFSVVLPIGLLLFIFIQSSSPTEVENTIGQEDKHKGAHVFGYLDSTNIKPLLQTNIDWITLVPFGAQKDFDSSDVYYSRGDSLQDVRRDSIWKSQIELAHNSGLNVFLKPHIWLTANTEGKWRSDIFPSSDENWELWKKQYRNFTLFYATMAEKTGVEMFCVGAELTRLTLEKPEYWRNLITEVRNIYSGKLTYAANWYEEYENIVFWDDLDYIGVQAYFPLVSVDYPSVDELSKGWDKYMPTLDSIHEKFDKKIIFTEMGYKSTPDSGTKPWLWVEDTFDKEVSASNETQANCYQSFFSSVWNKDWFSGVHIWKMRSDYAEEVGPNKLDFSPQTKPAERVITEGFK